MSVVDCCFFNFCHTYRLIFTFTKPISKTYLIGKFPQLWALYRTLTHFKHFFSPAASHESLAAYLQAFFSQKNRRSYINGVHPLQSKPVCMLKPARQAH
jgi:hypothetical protein